MLEDQFKSLEREFANEGIMAVAMKRTIAAARHAFEIRKAETLVPAAEYCAFISS